MAISTRHLLSASNKVVYSTDYWKILYSNALKYTNRCTHFLKELNTDKNMYDESDVLSSQNNTDEYLTNTLINAEFTED